MQRSKNSNSEGEYEIVYNEQKQQTELWCQIKENNTENIAYYLSGGAFYHG